ncbi:MAG: hypothetical protein ACI3ZQ_02560 [Candidatus Cryptobacteroides sp.]
MKGFYRLFLCMTGLMACLGSCVRESLDNTHFTGQEQEDAIIVDFLLDGGRNVNVRSVLSDDIDTKISNVYLAVYCKGALITVQEAAYLDKIELKGVHYGEKYNLYAMANIDVQHNAIEDIFPYMEAGLQESGYSLSGSYMEIDRLGLPMVASKRDVEFEKGGKPVVMNLVRLFAKLTLSFNFDGLLKDCNDKGIYEEFDQCFMITGAKIRQAASVLYPFVEPDGRKAASADEISDDADHNDIDLYMTSDGSPGQQKSYLFYVPENCQGKLLPDNKDNMCKTKENISNLGGKDYSSLCTYLDVKCTLDGSVIDESVLPYAGDITYRYYLGEDNCSDFSIKRNIAYNMTVDYSLDGMTLMGNWKVEHENWSDYRIIRFGKSVYEVQQGKCVDVFLNFADVPWAVGSTPLSYSPGGLWKYHFPEELETDGLTYSFAPNLLKKNPDSGADDFYFVFWADEDAEIGKEYELAAWCTGYGSETDSDKYVTAKIRVVEPEVIEAPEFSWLDDYCPEYIAQEGEMIFNKNISSVSFSNPEVFESTDYYRNRLRVVNARQGKTLVDFVFEDGTTAQTVLTVLPPILKVKEGPSVILDSDKDISGTAWVYYCDWMGEPLNHFNLDAFAKYLKVQTKDHPFVQVHSCGDCVDDWWNEGIDYIQVNLSVSSFHNDEGEEIAWGSDYYVPFCAPASPSVASADVAVSVVDPLESLDANHFYGAVQDYSLFTREAEAAVELIDYYEAESCKRHELNVFEIPDLSIKNNHLSVSLYKDGTEIDKKKYRTWNVSTDGSNLLINLAEKDRYYHEAGRYETVYTLFNRYRGDRITRHGGYVDFYLHTSSCVSATIYSPHQYVQNSKLPGTSFLPDRPDFPANKEVNNECFLIWDWHENIPKKYKNRSFYNMKTENLIEYNYYFSAYIHVMDVHLAFMHSSDFDGSADFFSDQTRGNEDRLLCKYSNKTDLSDKKFRIRTNMDASGKIIAESEMEKLRQGKGLIYRKIMYDHCDVPGLYPDADTLIAPVDVFDWVNEGGRSETICGPEVEYLVDTTQPYYWAPLSNTERDDEGRGYYVIHFLGEIAPYRSTDWESKRIFHRNLDYIRYSDCNYNRNWDDEYSL